MMRAQVLLTLLLAAALPGLAQATNPPGLPQDPNGVFTIPALIYDYSAFKPWHLKASYQLYDNAGKPAAEGIFEYWSASPQLYRSSWTRPNGSYTEWRTADGKFATQSTGQTPGFFEYKLRAALLTPLTSAGALDPTRFRLDPSALTAPGSVVSCFNTVPVSPKADPAPKPVMGLYPTYCFNNRLKILLGIDSFGAQTVKFNNFTQYEGRQMPRGIYFREGLRSLLSATVDAIAPISPTDSALTPPADAQPALLDKVSISEAVAAGLLAKKVAPVYPPDAKAAHIEGKVVLQATIGIDGKLRDLVLLSAPSPSLASSAFWAVSQWLYKPYLLNGQPAEVETPITVTYSLAP